MVHSRQLMENGAVTAKVVAVVVAAAVVVDAAGEAVAAAMDRSSTPVQCY